MLSVLPFRVVRKSLSLQTSEVIGMKQMKGLLRFPSCLPGNERQRTLQNVSPKYSTLFKMSRFHREVARLRGKSRVRRSNSVIVSFIPSLSENTYQILKLRATQEF